MNVIDSIFDKQLIKELERLSIPLFYNEYATGKIFFVNKAIEMLMGHPVEKYYAESMDFFVSLAEPEDMARIAQEIAAQTFEMAKNEYDLTKIPLLTFHNKFKHANGLWKWLEVQTFIIDFTKEKIPNRIITLVKDITPRIESELFLWSELQKREPNAEKFNMIKEQHDKIASNLNTEVKIDWQYLSLKYSPIRTLSEREMEILQLIAKGKTTQEMAEMLYLSNHTIEAHRKNILKKFKVKNVAELITEASKSYWMGN
ncbi:MAG: LuxR C-terminal-related transcriptional regulator [Cytophagales bacterium]